MDPKDTLRPDDVKPNGDLPVRDAAGVEREDALRRARREAAERTPGEDTDERPRLGNLHDPGE